MAVLNLYSLIRCICLYIQKLWVQITLEHNIVIEIIENIIEKTYTTPEKYKDYKLLKEIELNNSAHRSVFEQSCIIRLFRIKQLCSFNSFVSLPRLDCF